MNDDEHGLQHHQRHRREVLDGVVRGLLEQRHVAGVRRGSHQKCVAISGRVDDGHGADHRIAACLVLDHDALSENVRQSFGQDPGADINWTPGSVGDDQLDRTGWPGLGAHLSDRTQPDTEHETQGQTES